MKHLTTSQPGRIGLAAAALIASLSATSTSAALLNISNTPLSSSSAAQVKPNLLLTMDTSGSMAWDFMPDNAAPDVSQDNGEKASSAYNCLQRSGSNNNCLPGDPPYYANQFNFIAYNPTFTYAPGVNYDGTSKPSQTTFSSVAIDGYNSGAGTISLSTISGSVNLGGFPEQVYQSSASNCLGGGSCYYKRNGEAYSPLVGGGNLPPTQLGVTVTAFSYATPAKPSITGVSVSGFGSGTGITGTVGSGAPAIGDVIDVICTTGSGATTPFVIANAVPVTGSNGTTSFTFTAGQSWSGGGVSCTKATVNYSVIGYPEPADSSGNALSVGGGNWALTVPGVSSGAKNSSGTVTVNFYNHGLSLGDTITVSGGGSNCTVTKTQVLSVTLGTAGYAAVPISFTYKAASSGSCSGVYTIKRLAFNSQVPAQAPPFYYTITPTEYCSDRHLTTCALPASGGGAPSGYPFPAPVRYCKAQTGTNSAAAAGPVTGGTSATQPYCQSKYLYTAGYIYPRYGQFTRTDVSILSGMTYPNYAGRIDCGSGTTCTGTQETTNFANWYTYYRTRILMMKTLIGQTFLNLTSSYRVGYVTINPGSSSGAISSGNPVSSSHYVPVSDFTSSQKQTFYSTLYAQSAGQSTPLRSALARAGRYFAGKHDSINSGMNDDPVQYSCQQNFTLLTTDGYWNTNLSNGDKEAVQLDGSTVVGDQDGNPNFQVVFPGPTASENGTYEGPKGVNYSNSPPSVLSSCQAGSYNNGGCSNTLADVAAYYYNTDLRTSALGNASGALGTDVSQNNVPTTQQDPANWQHLTTFTLGLADGLLTFQSNYETSTGGDFYNILNGNTDPSCWWLPSNGTATCQWPVPFHDSPTALDDLWHAAVNGHGSYYHGTNPKSVASGLSSALAGINVRLAAAAASSTSSPNITQQNNVIYSSTYDTVQWSGDLIAQTVDPTTGVVNPAVIWDAAVTLDNATGATSDSRTIWTYDNVNHILKPFQWASLSGTEQAVFTNVCGVLTNLSQCPTLTSTQLTTINNGQDLLNFIRGQRGDEMSSVSTNPNLFRARVHVLGDTVDAQPAYVATPIYAFADAVSPSYGAFQTANASRQPVLYLGANDGMLHAFNANAGTGSTGNELWAYVPRMLWSNLYILGDTNYANLHTYFVDGSPATMDVYFGGAWHTILVGGLNSGGRGYYALDVTNPVAPIALWEFCANSSLCPVSDADLGLSYGNPIITKRASDGRWVVLVTSGYNNVPGVAGGTGGSGQEFLYVLDVQTGAVLQKLGTGAGSTASPGGLAKIAGWADNFNQNNTTKYVYGGDLQGNVWRFDLTTSPATFMQLGVLTDSSGNPQPVTTRPELGIIQNSRVVYIGTGEYVGTPDLSNTQTQSFYAFKDPGTAYGNIRTQANLVKQTITVNAGGTTSTTTSNSVDWSQKNGWYVDFPNTGERVNIDPQLVLGTLLVDTNIPGSSACQVGGSSWFYEFNYMTGSYVSTSPNQVVGMYNANAVQVGFVVVQLPSGAIKSINTDATAAKSTQGVNLGASPLSGKRVGWRQL